MHDDNKQYDAIILGSGPGGNAAAERIAFLGGTVCQVEAGRVGGTCVNVGCMPTKAMLAASERFYEMSSASEMGFDPCRPDLDEQAFCARIRNVAETLNRSMRDKLDRIENVDLVDGYGRIEDAQTVRIETGDGDRTVHGRALVVATGSEPVRLDKLPWDSGRIWTSNDALQIESLPESVIVLGGGALGCEFATAWAELGLDVTIIERHERLLPGLDGMASKAARESLEQRGAEIHCSVEIDSARAEKDRILVSDGQNTWSAERLLCAAGRTERLTGFGLETIGLDRSRGPIPVDETCRTEVEEVYAVGDVAEPRKHAHLAARMGTVAGNNIMGLDSRDDRRVVPVGVYTHPEIACVGLCGEDGQTDGDDLIELREDYAHSGSAYVRNRRAGGIKLVVDQPSGRICGCVWIGPQAVDMIQEVVLAMRAGMTLQQISHTIPGHPSYQELLHTLAERFEKQQISSRRG
jgi:dihydrolipoamide dehydrogenase